MKDTWPGIVVIILSFALLVFSVNRGWTHSWYDDSCCSTVDCAPVEDGLVEEKAGGVHVKGFGVMSYQDSRLRWSRDEKDHLCISTLSKELLCVYRRPKGF